jgi:ribokinase
METDRRAVAVVGSVHMDLIAVADRLPVRGESLTGRRFGMHPGGKAGNQAAQVALQGVPTYVVARVGNDHFGGILRDRLREKGVDTSYLATDPSFATGASPLLVGGDGEYASIIVPGAAAGLSERDVDAARAAIARSAAVMLQLEIPAGATLYAARTARELGAAVVLNASPAPSGPDEALDELLGVVDVLVVNGLEAERLGGAPVMSLRAASDAAAWIRTRFAIPTVVVTVGDQGAVAVCASGKVESSAWAVGVVDTVGAGDAFVGTLVAERARGTPLDRALHVATAAGALAVTRSGAFDALPSRAELLAFMAERSL